MSTLPLIWPAPSHICLHPTVTSLVPICSCYIAYSFTVYEVLSVSLFFSLPSAEHIRLHFTACITMHVTNKESWILYAVYQTLAAVLSPTPTWCLSSAGLVEGEWAELCVVRTFPCSSPFPQIFWHLPHSWARASLWLPWFWLCLPQYPVHWQCGPGICLWWEQTDTCPV